MQDAIVLARTLRDALGGPGTHSLKQHTLVKVDEALRDFERERTRRKLKISVKSNLMGAALQIPFAPVSALGLRGIALWACCLAKCEAGGGRRVVTLLLKHIALQPTRPASELRERHNHQQAVLSALRKLSELLQVVAARNYAVSNILPTKDVLDHAMYDCGTL